MKAGTLQRARKTPQTITSETVMGEICGLTSLIGASAPPSQAPAANPQKMPRACSERRRPAGTVEIVGDLACTLAGRRFNGVYPEAEIHRGELPVGSRNEGRWRSRGRDYVKWEISS